MDPRLYPGFQSSHRALGFGEPLGKLDLELGGLMRCRCDSGKDVTRQQPHGEPVRIVNNDRIVDDQTERRRGRHGRSQRTLGLSWLHPADFLTAAGLHSPGLLFSPGSFALGKAVSARQQPSATGIPDTQNARIWAAGAD